MLSFYPEGMHYSHSKAEAVHRAVSSGEILQGLCVKCDEYQNMYIDLGEIIGVIPKEETAIDESISTEEDGYYEEIDNNDFDIIEDNIEEDSENIDREI